MAASDVNSEILRKQLMVNQMVNAVCCTPEQATTILQRAQWHLEAALSLFFDENAILPAPPVQPGYNRSSASTSAGSAQSLGMRVASYAVPTNTPATPPQLMDTLQQFERMNASSPATGDLFEPSIVKCHTKAGDR